MNIKTKVFDIALSAKKMGAVSENKFLSVVRKRMLEMLKEDIDGAFQDGLIPVTCKPITSSNDPEGNLVFAGGLVILSLEEYNKIMYNQKEVAK